MAIFGCSAAKRVAQRAERVGELAGRSPPTPRGTRCGRRRQPQRALVQACVRRRAARADVAPGGRIAVGHVERRRAASRAPRAPPAISSAPSGAPCAFSLPCRSGAPKPMIVRQAISEGRSLSRSAAMAAATPSGSWPSTRRTDQPEAAKRASWSSEHDSEVAPSMEMPLSSNSTISRRGRDGRRARSPPG